jgi:hypothetical protein
MSNIVGGSILNIGVDTTIQDNKIYQEFFSDFNSIRTVITRQVLDTAEEHVIQALIKMGWTPPPKKEELCLI